MSDVLIGCKCLIFHIQLMFQVFDTMICSIERVIN